MKERPLYGLEVVFSALNEVGASTAVFAASVSGPLDSKTLEAAVRTVAARHALLRTRAIERDGTLWFEESSVKTPLVEREIGSEADVARVFESACRPFDRQTGPLARFTWARENANRHWLFFEWMHALSDGSGAVRILRELVEECAHPTLSERPSDFALEPSLQEFLRGVPTAARVVPQNQTLLPIEGEAPPSMRRPGIRLFRVDETDWSRFCTISKSHGAKPGSAFSAIVLRALWRVYGDTPPLNVISNRSLRAHLAPDVDREALGNAMYAYFFECPLVDVDVWARARELANRDREKAEHPTTFPSPPPWPTILASIREGTKQREGRRTPLALTNFGRVPLARRYGALEVDGFYPAVSQAVTGNQLAFSFAAFGDSLTGAMSFATPTTSPATADRILSNVYEEIRAVLNSSEAIGLQSSSG